MTNGGAQVEVIDGVLFVKTPDIRQLDNYNVNPPHDISALAMCRNLEIARFGLSEIPLDIEPLTNCPELKQLYLYRPVVSGEPLTRCHKLSVLEFQGESNDLALPPLLRALGLYSYYGSLRFLMGHPSLQTLCLVRSNPTDLDILPTLPRLKRVALIYSPDIDPKNVHAYDERYTVT